MTALPSTTKSRRPTGWSPAGYTTIRGTTQLLAIKPKEHASKVECTASLNVDSEQPEVMALLRYDAGVLTRKGQADDG